MVTNAIPSKSTTYTVANSGETWVLDAANTIDVGTGPGILETATYHDNTIIVNGTIKSTAIADFAITSNGDRSVVKVGKEAEISGNIGVVMSGANSSGSNAGHIDGAFMGVYVAGANGSFVNSGVIESSVGAAIYGDIAGKGTITNKGTLVAYDGIRVQDTADLKVTLTLGSHINSSHIGVHVDSEAGEKASISNRGSILGNDGMAFQGGSGRELLTNAGYMDGNIDLGGGADRFDNAHGTLVGSVSGGAGNDLYIIGSRKTAIVELAKGGKDTVVATQSYSLDFKGQDHVENLTLKGQGDVAGTGNGLANRIIGNAADNRLFGAAGNDVLIGGLGDDVFVFRTKSARDTITDFNAVDDRIDLSGLSAVTSFADLMSHHASQSGGDVIIVAGADRLTLKSVDMDDLAASDFIF